VGPMCSNAVISHTPAPGVAGESNKLKKKQ